MSGAKLVNVLCWLAYPFAIFFGLQVMQPRYVAILLAALLLLRHRKDAGKLLSGLPRINLLFVALLLGLAGLTALSNSELLLRFYPAAMSTGMLMLFGSSLFNPPSMIERFARISVPDLPPEGVIYTRHVTQIWCVFLLGNSLVACYTALYASRETWALYNGFIAYMLMGVLFVGECLYRRYIRSGTAH